MDYKTWKSWTENRDTTSEFETYTFVIKGQEISTKYITKYMQNDK